MSDKNDLGLDPEKLKNFNPFPSEKKESDQERNRRVLLLKHGPSSPLKGQPGFGDLDPEAAAQAAAQQNALRQMSGAPQMPAQPPAPIPQALANPPAQVQTQFDPNDTNNIRKALMGR